MRADKIIAAMDSGDSWTHLAVIDYMVETNLLKEVSPAGTWGQYRVFVTRAWQSPSNNELNPPTSTVKTKHQLSGD